MKKAPYLSFVLVISVLISSCTKEKEEEYMPLYEINYNSKVPDFDAEYAYNQIEQQVSFGPRNPNSKGHKEALNYLYKELSKYSKNIKLQPFSYSGYNNERLELTNIITKFNPEKKHRIILCAHWDTRPRSDMDKEQAYKNKPILGANDGASGVGILLEIAKLLSQNKINYGVDIILFDGEDYGKRSDLTSYSLGAKYFSSNLPADYKPAFGVLLDMVGDKDANFPIEGNSKLYAPGIVNTIWNLAEQVQADKFINKEDEAIYDDHITLNESGILTADIIDLELIGANTPVERRNYWHTHSDTMQNIGKSTLEQVGKVITKLIWSIRFNNV